MGDTNQNVYDVNIKGYYNKPLIEKIYNIDTQLRWLIPIVSNKNNICAKDVIETHDIQLINQDHLIELEKIQNSYFKERTNGQAFTYKSFNLRTNSLLSNFSKPDNIESHLETKEVLTNIDAIVDKKIEVIMTNDYV